MTRRGVASVKPLMLSLVLLAAACGNGSDPVLTAPGAGTGPAQNATTTDLAAVTTAPGSTAAPTTTLPYGLAVLELVSAAPSEPGQQFDVRYGPPADAAYTVGLRGAGFLLSRDGKRLFWLYDVTHSSSPHNNPYQHIDSGGSNSTGFIPGTVTLVLPEGLGPGTYELCAESLDVGQDPCLTITVDK